MATLDIELFQRLQQAMIDDPEMQVSGRFMDCDILFGSDADRFILRFEHGQLAEIIPAPHPSFAWHFALKAPEGTWARFLQDTPPPEYNDLWAAAFTGHLVLEGDMRVFMQNHFALWHVMRMLRAQAVTVTVGT
jgi:hypothetical protein